jgi:peptide chain release factor 3
VAYPGDVVGLVNTGALRVGDTLFQGRPVRYPPIPSFAPEHFAAVRAKDFGRFKQFRRGVAQLAEEGVVQVLRSDFRGEATPVLAAVGPMQFEVVTHRLAEEFGAEAVLDQLGYSIAMRTDEASAVTLRTISGIEVLTRVVDEVLLVLFPDKWRLAWVQRQHPDVLLEPLVAATS